MNPFEKGVEALATIAPENAFTAFFQIFRAIGSMDQKEVVAAYQALEFYSQVQKIELSDLRVGPIRKALWARMDVIISEASDPQEKDRLSGLFLRIADHRVSLFACY